MQCKIKVHFVQIQIMVPDLSGVILAISSIFKYFQHTLNVITQLQNQNEEQDEDEEDEEDEFPPLAPLVIAIQNIFQIWQQLLVIQRKRRGDFWSKPHKLLELLNGCRNRHCPGDLWSVLEGNWQDFFWLTGEVPPTLDAIVRNMELLHPRHTGRIPDISFRNQILLIFMWLRRYPTMAHLSMHFNISIPVVCRTIHRLMPKLHAYLVPKHIKWHSMGKWRSLIGTYPTFPNVVAIIDCTPVRIGRPKGLLQRTFYRKDRHSFNCNWLVIIDAEGTIVYSRPGFVGHLHDSTCYRYCRLPVLPAGLQIMADQGFPNESPLLLPVRRHGLQLPRTIKRQFRKHRSYIERCFGILKSSYHCINVKQFRSRRWQVPIVCNVTAALYNRRRIIFKFLRMNL